MTPVGAAVFSLVLVAPPDPRDRDRRICAIDESARDRGTGRRETTAAVAPGIESGLPDVRGWAEIAIAVPNCAIAKPSTKSSTHERRAHHDAIASIAAIAIVDARRSRRRDRRTRRGPPDSSLTTAREQCRVR